jgi:hypothetical protein
MASEIFVWYVQFDFHRNLSTGYRIIEYNPILLLPILFLGETGRLSGTDRQG